jgi:hypothetical protein
MVGEPDTGAGGDGGAVVDRTERAECGGDRDLAVEPNSSSGVGKRDEPFRPRQVGGHGDTRERRCDVVVGLDDDEHRGALACEPLETLSVLLVEPTLRDVGLVPPISDHAADHSDEAPAVRSSTRSSC